MLATMFISFYYMLILVNGKWSPKINPKKQKANLLSRKYLTIGRNWWDWRGGLRGHL